MTRVRVQTERFDVHNVKVFEKDASNVDFGLCGIGV